MHYKRIVQACIDMNIDIMQFRQHCARADKQNANFDHYFGISLRFLLKSTVCYLLLSFITSFIKFNRNTIYVISEKIKNLTGDHERHSEFE